MHALMLRPVWEVGSYPMGLCINLSPVYKLNSQSACSLYPVSKCVFQLQYNKIQIQTYMAPLTIFFSRDVVLESRTWTRVRLESRFLGLGLGLGLDTSGLETWTWHIRTWTWFSISLVENPDSQSEILNHLFWKSIKADLIGSSLFSKLLWHWIYLAVYQCIKSWRNHYEAT